MEGSYRCLRYIYHRKSLVSLEILTPKKLFVIFLCRDDDMIDQFWD